MNRSEGVRSSDSLHFIDANVPLYAVGAAHPLRQPCLDILTAIADGRLKAVTDVEVLQEILHRYTSLGQRMRAVEVADLFHTIVPGALPITTDDFLLASQFHTQHLNLQARDSLHLAVTHRQGIEGIISADRHFDGIPGIMDHATGPCSGRSDCRGSGGRVAGRSEFLSEARWR